MARLSVVLTTLNEVRNIDRCLGSVRWADEIIVVDSFSTDGTVEAARRYTEHVYVEEYPGSSRQVERGIARATGEWIFVIDADEEVTPSLAADIRRIVAEDPPLAGYDVLRKARAFGRWIGHGGWFPDYQFRFFRRDRYSANHQEVHGGFEPNGPRGRIDALLLHHTYETVFSYVEKMNDYTSLEVPARLRRRPGVEVRKRHLLLSPLSHFLRMYVAKRGYRDGMHGFVLGLLEATYAMLLQAKIWEFQEREREGTQGPPPVTNAALNLTRRHR